MPKSDGTRRLLLEAAPFQENLKEFCKLPDSMTQPANVTKGQKRLDLMAASFITASFIAMFSGLCV